MATLQKLILDERLTTCLQSTDDFDKLYIELTSLACECFHAGKRFKLVWIARDELSTLYYHRSQWTQCLEQLGLIDSTYGENGWNIIDSQIMTRMVVCYKNLCEYDKLADLYLRLLSYPEHLNEDLLDEYTSDLVQGLLKSPEILDSFNLTVKREAKPLINAELGSLTNRLGDFDGIELQITIFSSMKNVREIHYSILI